VREFSYVGPEGRFHGVFGKAQDFDMFDDAPAVLAEFEGDAGWLESIRATGRGRGDGTKLMHRFLEMAEQEVDFVGLQVVPDPQIIDGSPEFTDEAIERLVAWYERFGFEEAPDLAPWSDFPIMLWWNEG